MIEFDRKIIYIHGFNSAGKKNSRKMQSLEKLGEVITLNYDSFDSYNNILKDLGKKFKDTIYESLQSDWAVAGTSLGGYWAAVLGKTYGIPAVLINPSVTPSKTMQKNVGKKLRNFVTGEENVLSKEVAQSYPDIPNKGAFLILLDEADDVLDPSLAKKHFSKFGVVSFEGGSHRFEHMEESLPHIQQFFYAVSTVI